MTSDPDAGLIRLREHAERLNVLADRLSAIRATENTPDGAITVVVDGNGALVDLQLSVAVARLSPREFGRALVAAAEQAAGRAFAEHGELITAFAVQDPTSIAAVADTASPERRA